MLDFLIKALMNGDNPSSARLINFGGWLVGTILLIIDYYNKLSLDYNNFSTYLLYCGGSYIGGKAVGSVQNYIVERRPYGNNQQIQRSPNVRDVAD